MLENSRHPVGSRLTCFPRSRRALLVAAVPLLVATACWSEDSDEGAVEISDVSSSPKLPAEDTSTTTTGPATTAPPTTAPPITTTTTIIPPTTTPPPTTTVPPTTTTTAPPAESAISLSIDVTAVDQHIRSGTLECGNGSRGTGHLAEPEAAQAACDLLEADDARNRLVEGYQQSEDMLCTMIHGGPDVATVTGTVDSQPVDTSFSRQDGCAIADFDWFEALIGSAAGLNPE